MNQPCGLYIHIPFCTSKCLYCDFYSKAQNREEIDRYVVNMQKMLQLYSKIYPNKIFDTIYIGGGTPSVIGTENLISIITKASECFNITSDTEITIEMNPRSAQTIDFKKLANCKVNRISLGIQSANENELKLLGRTHCNIDVTNAVNMIRNAGINNISLDLMVGISQQTESSLIDSMDFCIKQKPTHISAYILKVEENTPYKKLAPKLNLPDDDKQAELYTIMQMYLEEKGYKQYEISNFAQNGFESRHNLKYWNCDEYLGLGASAHSLMNRKRFYFPRDMQSFYNNKVIEDGIGATANEYIMLRLRLAEGLVFSNYENFFGSVPERCIDVAKKYKKYGLTNINEKGISLTKKGFLVSNSIIAEMLES
ncbi:MAG: radical SAM family heme chaperone HemW [Acutalibacteraceae bacterium]|nr:radical SAM family heme chaperone HemW [Acutalibacteraceae bacterium]